MHPFFAKMTTYYWMQTYGVKSSATQWATYCPGSPVRRYDAIPAVTEALQHIQYRSDTAESLLDSLTGLPRDLGQGALAVAEVLGKSKDKVDFLRHPTQMQKGIDAGTPDLKIHVGDCEDYAGFIAAALIKGRLAVGVKLVCLSWRRTSGEVAAHMVCAYEREGQRYWQGNWKGGAPYEGEVIAGMEAVVRAPMTEVCEWRVGLRHDDTLLLIAPRRVR